MLYDVINYNNVMFAADSYESLKTYVSLMYRLWKILLSNMPRPETFGMAIVTMTFNVVISGRIAMAYLDGRRCCQWLDHRCNVHQRPYH